MKLSLPLSLLLPFFLFACATVSPPAPPPAAPVVEAPPPAPVPDSIAGKVVSDDGVLPAHLQVRLLSGNEEISRQAADENGKYRFDGPFTKGHYELAVSAGALHGAREISFPGGEMKDVNIVIAKSEPRRHHRRRRRSDD